MIDRTISLTDREVDLMFTRVQRHEEPRRRALGGRIVRPAPAFHQPVSPTTGRVRRRLDRIRRSPAAADLRRLLYGSTADRAPVLLAVVVLGFAITALVVLEMHWPSDVTSGGLR